MADIAKIRQSQGELLPLLKQIMLDESGPDEGRRTDVIHPSELCKSDCCHRAITMRILGWKVPEGTFNFVLENIFAEGNEIHAKWQKRMAKTGRLWGDWKCRACKNGPGVWARQTSTPDELDTPRLAPGSTRVYTNVSQGCVGGPYALHDWEYMEVPLTAEDTYLMTGHADGGLDDYLVEIKSVGVGTLRVEAPKLMAKWLTKTRQGKSIYDLDALWKDLKRPFTTHVRQANLYLWMAREMGLPFDHMVFIYEFKPNQQVKEFSIKLNEEILAKLLAQAMIIKRGVDSGVLPPCPAGGCKQCQSMEAFNKNNTAAILERKVKRVSRSPRADHRRSALS